MLNNVIHKPEHELYHMIFAQKLVGVVTKYFHKHLHCFSVFHCHVQLERFSAISICLYDIVIVIFFQ